MCHVMPIGQVSFSDATMFIIGYNLTGWLEKPQNFISAEEGIFILGVWSFCKFLEYYIVFSL